MGKEVKLVAVILSIVLVAIYAYDNGYLFPGATGPGQPG